MKPKYGHGSMGLRTKWTAVLAGAAACGCVIVAVHKGLSLLNDKRLLSDEPATLTSITTFDDPALEWHNGSPNDAGGSAKIDNNGKLHIIPVAGIDYWCRTFYVPLLVKTDAQTLLGSVPEAAEATLTMAFTLKPRAQFDQAGIMVLVSANTWVKAGIEFTDGAPRLSCVVTNEGFSDWSTQHWDQWDKDERSTSVRIRVSKLLPGPSQGTAVVMEAALYKEGDSAASPAKWFQVRIASLRSGSTPWQMGLFAISPIAQDGSSTTFHHIELGGKVEPVHDTDPKHGALEN